MNNTSPAMDNECRSIVLEYLLHRCYKNTAKTFLEEQKKFDACESQLDNGTTTDKQRHGHDNGMVTSDELMEVNDSDARWAKLDARKDLYGAVESGDIPRAFEILNKHFPALVVDHQGPRENGDISSNSNADAIQTVLFKLRCQQFVEIVRSSTEAEAIEFGQVYLKPMEKRYRAMIDEAASLIAFTDPYQSKAKHLLTDEHKSSLAEEVNRLVLAQCNLPAEAVMETIYKQKNVVKEELKKLEQAKQQVGRGQLSE